MMVNPVLCTLHVIGWCKHSPFVSVSFVKASLAVIGRKLAIVDLCECLRVCAGAFDCSVTY